MPDSAEPDGRVDLGGVRLSGRRGNDELAGIWQVAFLGGTLSLAQGDRKLELPAGSLSGAELHAESLELSLTDGGQLVLEGSDRLRELASALDRAELQVGEMLRASRTLGSRRARPGTDHDTFFAPFLAARRSLAAREDLSPMGSLDLPEVRLLRPKVVEALSSIAASHFPEQPADRRALVAELDDCAAPLFGALDRLDAAAEDVRAAGSRNRYVAWREWRRALAECFLRAESSWMATLPALDGLGEWEFGGNDMTARSKGE